MAGASKLQKLAATITPPVKPNIPSRRVRFKFRKKNTDEAPSAVMAHVNSVAKKAPVTGLCVSSHEMSNSNMPIPAILPSVRAL
jgi:hypothetical protein